MDHKEKHMKFLYKTTIVLAGTAIGLSLSTADTLPTHRRAIGASGAPGAKLDDNCARAGLAKIRDRLK
jgi:hypothetical protein